jgi:DNA-binding MarR family transcriptional regulator
MICVRIKYQILMPDFTLSQKIGGLRRAIRREFEAEILDFDITATQFLVLKRLWQQDGMGAKCLGREAHLDGATLTGVLDRLEAKDLVRREKHEKDRRSVRIFLNEAGRDLEKPLLAALKRVNDKALTGFVPEETSLLLGFLERMQSNLDSAIVPQEKLNGECRDG